MNYKKAVEMRARYANGEKVKNIAETYGVSYAVVDYNRTWVKK